jgi:anti-anti-sigma factor
MDPAAEFSVDVQACAGGVVIAPHGEIDVATAPGVRAALREADGTAVLDLRGVSFLDTSGINLVVEHQRRADAEGLRFALVPGPAEVQRLFDMTGLNHRLTFIDDAREVVGDRLPRP